MIILYLNFQFSGRVGPSYMNIIIFFCFNVGLIFPKLLNRGLGIATYSIVGFFSE